MEEETGLAVSIELAWVALEYQGRWELWLKSSGAGGQSLTGSPDSLEAHGLVLQGSPAQTP